MTALKIDGSLRTAASRIPILVRHALAGLLMLATAGAAAAGQTATVSAAASAVTADSTNDAQIASAQVRAPVGFSSAAPNQTLFSDPPRDAEILGCGILSQPLAPTSARADADENRALGQALAQYGDSQRGDALRDAVGPLTDFIKTRPRSRWCAALYMNLGVIYRQTGHLSKAMASWQRAWDLSNNATDSKARAIADYSVGELAEFEAYLGRMETLAPLLAEVKGRPMHGSGASKISDASQGLAEMRTHPGNAFLCG